MTILKALLLALSFITLSTVGVALVALTAKPEPIDAGTSVKAPEFDATAGVQAIALLSGILLVVSERSRRRKV